MEIPAEWILGVIGTLAGIIYHSLNSRIKSQTKIIDRLQEDVDRLSQGCGVEKCLWKGR